MSVLLSEMRRNTYLDYVRAVPGLCSNRASRASPAPMEHAITVASVEREVEKVDPRLRRRECANWHPDRPEPRRPQEDGSRTLKASAPPSFARNVDAPGDRAPGQGRRGDAQARHRPVGQDAPGRIWIGRLSLHTDSGITRGELPEEGLCQRPLLHRLTVWATGRCTAVIKLLSKPYLCRALNQMPMLASFRRPGR